MPDTLREMVGSLRLQCPDLPYFLGVQFIRNRYRDMLGGRNWSFLRAESVILTETAYTTGTAALTRNSVNVVGTGTAWTAAMIGRQFWVAGSGPPYTIVTVPTGTTMTLDRVWAGSTVATQTYAIVVALVTMPVDFKQFIVVVDSLRAWQLRFWMSQEDLGVRDPQRSTSGDPIWLVDLGRHATTQAPMFELWPYATTERNYHVRYFKEGVDLTEPDHTPVRPISGETLVRGAMADVLRWVGTLDRPNPLWAKAVEMSAQYERMFADGVASAEVEDENLMMTWLRGPDWQNWPTAPLDAKWLQSHAIGP